MSFLYYERAFDDLWRQLLFSILQDTNIANPLLTAIIKMYVNSEINIKLDPALTQPKN
jgi:hypothetical protein